MKKVKLNQSFYFLSDFEEKWTKKHLTEDFI
jgi:hypothetical protein